MKAELYWVEGVSWGRLAVMPRPRGGDWLVDELRSWQQQGLQTVVSLLRAYEVADLDLADEAALCAELGLEFISFPITDHCLPDSADDLLGLLDTLESRLREGRAVGVHCRMGVGRSALVAACLLMKAGKGARVAFAAISRARGLRVPETARQAHWVEELAERLRGKSDPRCPKSEADPQSRAPRASRTGSGNGR
jgi:protein-tyrosine phosphatase